MMTFWATHPRIHCARSLAIFTTLHPHPLIALSRTIMLRCPLLPLPFPIRPPHSYPPLVMLTKPSLMCHHSTTIYIFQGYSTPLIRQPLKTSTFLPLAVPMIQLLHVCYQAASKPWSKLPRFHNNDAAFCPGTFRTPSSRLNELGSPTWRRCRSAHRRPPHFERSRHSRLSSLLLPLWLPTIYSLLGSQASPVPRSDHLSSSPESRSSLRVPASPGPSHLWPSSAPDLGAAAEREGSAEAASHMGMDALDPPSAMRENIFATPDHPPQSPSVVTY
ncbi:hypothetical protein EDB84DRAFT_404225 [Lactarius hengduanensis]|nr:hypothetical protein EDB84DRAFT_404225 [Lactarius hengduanensis]